MNLTSFINELSQNETIAKISNISAMLANLTTPIQRPLYAKDIDLAVSIVSTLNKYILSHFICYIIISCIYYSVTAAVVTNLTSNSTFFEVGRQKTDKHT